MAIRTQLYQVLGQHKNSGKRITLPSLAQACGVSYLTLYRWANGQINSTNHDLLSALCRELKCTPADLLAYIPDGDDHGT